MDIDKIRADFPILKRKIRNKPLVYFDNAATTQKPRAVISALTDFYENHNANIHRGVHTLSDEATQMVEATREKTARWIGAKDVRSVIFTRNTTEAINLVAHSWARKFLKSGDEIVLTEMEHHSNIVPWQMLAKEKGVKLVFIPVNRDGSLDLIKAGQLIGKKTKLVSFSAASNVLGTLNPIQEIIALAKEYKAATLIDAAQFVPHFKADVEEWGCDFLVFSAHKMLGPTGVGVLYGRLDRLEEMDPFLGGGDMIGRVTLDGFTTNVLPYKFEAGTPNIADTVAFGAALDYLEKIDLPLIRQHELSLTQRALDILSTIPNIEIYGPKKATDRCGVISFNLKDLHPHDVGTSFDLEGIAIRAGHHCCQPLMKVLGVPGTARISFYLYNTLDEVEKLSDVLKKTNEFFKRAVHA